VEGLQLLGEHVGLAEFRVHASSPLAGERLGDLRMRERYGVTVIGQWVGGRFDLAASADTRIGASVILVAAGAHENLAKVDSLAAPIQRTGPILVAGHGAVGRKVAQMLRDAGETAVVIDAEPAEGVDIVGNVLDRRVLDRAGVHQASAVVLALSNDGAGVLAAAIVRDFAPDVRLIARVNRAASVARLYQAGADFVLSMGQVAGQILAFHLLGENAVSLEPRLKFARVAAGGLVGAHPWRASVRERTGAGVVAVERGAGVIVQFDKGFRVEVGDTLFVCGTIESVDRYIREFDAALHDPA
jgi:Trk K+ transport system NAD-binding subunit